MPAYILAQVEVHDSAAFAAYSARVTPVVAAHGGRFLVRGGAQDRREGSAPERRIVILEFASMAGAQGFYDSADYAPLLAMRMACSAADFVIVEGVPG